MENKKTVANIIEKNEEGFAPVHQIEWDIPLWSEILPGLWLGGTHDRDTVDFPKSLYGSYESNDHLTITREDFDVVVTLYAWARPVDWFVEEVRYGFYDDNTIDVDLASIEHLVNFAYDRWKSGKKVLVRCQAGINRSSFVMCLILMRECYTAKNAIALMREKRSSSVLLNKSFEKFLLSLDEEPIDE